VFVLVGFFADKNFRAHDVVIGQYAGITALYVISAIAALISLVIPPFLLACLVLFPWRLERKSYIIYGATRSPKNLLQALADTAEN